MTQISGDFLVHVMTGDTSQGFGGIEYQGKLWIISKAVHHREHPELSRPRRMVRFDTLPHSAKDGSYLVSAPIPPEVLEGERSEGTKPSPTHHS